MRAGKKRAPYAALRRALAGRGLSGADVAGLLGISESALMRKLNGASDFYLSEMQMICECYGLEADIFFADFVA